MIPVRRHPPSRPDDGTVRCGQRTKDRVRAPDSCWPLKAGRCLETPLSPQFPGFGTATFDLTQISVHCMCRASKDAPCRPTRGPDGGLSFSAFAKYIIHEVERALHKAVHWGLAIANKTCTKETEPARGVDRAAVSRHAELPLTPLGPATLS